MTVAAERQGCSAPPTTDALTGLLNRHAVDPTDRRTGLLSEPGFVHPAIDADRFKMITDLALVTMWATRPCRRRPGC